MFLKGIIIAAPTSINKSETFLVEIEFLNLENSKNASGEIENTFFKFSTEIKKIDKITKNDDCLTRIYFDNALAIKGKAKLDIKLSKGFFYFGIDPYSNIIIDDTAQIKIECMTQINGNNNFSGPFYGLIIDGFYTPKFIDSIKTIKYKYYYT